MNIQPSDYKSKKKYNVKIIKIKNDLSKIKNHEDFMQAMIKLSGSIDDPTFVEPPEIKYESKRERIV